MTTKERAEIVATNMTAPADEYFRAQLANVIERAIDAAVADALDAERKTIADEIERREWGNTRPASGELQAVEFWVRARRRTLTNDPTRGDGECPPSKR